MSRTNPSGPTKLVWTFLCAAMAVAAPVLAQDPTPAPSPRPNEETIVRPPDAPAGGSETKVALPPAPAIDSSPKRVSVPGGGGGRDRDSVGAGALKGVQARDLQSGQARLVLSTGALTVRPGDRIGTDVVKTIEQGRILLTRELPQGGEAKVVVSFDAGGRGRVRIFYTDDPKPVAAPAVR